MKPICHIFTKLAPEPGLYSQGTVVDPCDYDLLFLSGQTGNIPGVEGEPVIDGGVAEQTTRALENLLSVVRKAGGGVGLFLSLDVFLKDPGTAEDRTASREALNMAYWKFFNDHGITKDRMPARALVWVAEVPLEYPKENTLVEIKGVAAIP